MHVVTSYFCAYRVDFNSRNNMLTTSTHTASSQPAGRGLVIDLVVASCVKMVLLLNDIDCDHCKCEGGGMCG